MTQKMFFKLKFWTHSVLVSVLIVVLVALTNKIHPINTAENSFIETLELFVMVGVLLVWLMAAVSAARSGLQDRAGTVSVAIAVAAIVFGGIGREVSWGRVYGIEEDWVDLLKLNSAVIFLAAFAASFSLFVLVLRKRAAFVLSVMGSHSTGWIVFAIVLFAIGMVFEDNQLGIEPHVLYEEVFETLSYSGLLIAGLVVYRHKLFVNLGEIGPLARADLAAVLTACSED